MPNAQNDAEKSIRIFVGSPNDMTAHRQAVRRAIEQLNDEGALVEPLEYLDWENDAFPAAGRAQRVILEQIGEFDIFVGIFGHRLGSPTGEAVAGTVEEYQVAYERFQKEGRPSILLYFHRVHQFPKLEQIDDLRRVAEFREAIDQQGLTAEYDTEDHLIELVRKHLAKTVLRFKSEKAESQARAANFLDEPRQDPGSEREVVDAPVDHRIDLLDLRLMLDAKLAWVSKHLLAGPDTPTFANVGSLAYDGYLPREQYVRLARLLAFDPGTVEAQEPEELASFARAVSQDVSNFRATVFDGYVRHVLRTEEWSVEDFEQSEDHRPDFIAAKDDRSFRVAPRLVTSRKSSIRDRAIKRLERTRDQPPVVTRRILVIPDISASPTSGPKTDPQIVKLCDLLSLLEP